MSAVPAREYEELLAGETWPASRLYHEQSKLTELRALEFREQMMKCDQHPDADESRANGAGRSTIPLPDVPRWARGPRLVSVLRRRRTWRQPFGPGAVKLRTLGTLLKLGFGTTGHLSGATPRVEARSWPSAGALYPLELHVLSYRCQGLDPGSYRYSAREHALDRVGDKLDPSRLRQVLLLPDPLPQPALFLVISGVFARCQRKYGERGYRFVLLEAGHAAQNILLTAEMAGLGVVPLGGCCEDPLARHLGLEPEGESPLYAIMLGCR